MLPARRRVLRPTRAYYKLGSPGMTREELTKLARSYAPQVIEVLRDMAKNAPTKSARDAARKVLQSRGINVGP